MRTLTRYLEKRTANSVYRLTTSELKPVLVPDHLLADDAKDDGCGVVLPHGLQPVQLIIREPVPTCHPDQSCGRGRKRHTRDILAKSVIEPASFLTVKLDWYRTSPQWKRTTQTMTMFSSGNTQVFSLSNDLDSES